jgi:hypothetical protein
MREKLLSKCRYCNDEIEEGYVGFDEDMCEICFDFYKEEEEE